MDFRKWRIYVWAFQEAAGQHGFLEIITRKFLKIFSLADQVGFDNNFMKY